VAKFRHFFTPHIDGSKVLAGGIIWRFRNQLMDEYIHMTL
jgi:hypothetical protein